MKITVLALLWLGCSLGYALPPTGLCFLSAPPAARNADSARLVLADFDCSDQSDDCSERNNSAIEWSRWSGVSAAMLRTEGATLTARLSAEPGDLTCTGNTRDGVLGGRYQFIPNDAFVQQMGSMGFTGISPDKQLGFLLLNVTTAWVKEMQSLGVTELSTNNLMGLKALKVTPEYVRAMSSAGFPELRAEKLTEMKAVGVTPEKAQEAKSLGFAPTEQELVQMSIFHIDRPFVERMRARGLKNLTLDKLIKIKLFKVAE